MEFTYKCLIVDDETPAHLVLKSHIEKFPELILTESIYNGKEAIELINNQHFDIVFLDIEMPLFNGLEVVKKLKQKPAIILTTAYNNFATEAFHLEVIDYLLKPIQFTRFEKAIGKAKYYLNQVSITKTIPIKIKDSEFELNIDEIIYIQSIGNYVKVYTDTSVKPLIIYYTLKNILKTLPNEQFTQIHKSYIVNKDFIKKRTFDTISLKNDLILPIGRKYKILLE